MFNFFIVLILIFQIVNLLLLAAISNVLVRLLDRANKFKVKPNRETGLVDLPQVPNYAQVSSTESPQGLILLKDQ